MEVAAPAGGALALSPAVVGGRRHKLKLVTKKKARKVLKKLGLKIRGGAEAAAAPDAAVALPAETLVKGGEPPAAVEAAPEVPAPAAGRRRKTKKTRRHSRRSVFGY